MPADVSSVVETHVALDQMHPPQHRRSSAQYGAMADDDEDFLLGYMQFDRYDPWYDSDPPFRTLGETENKLDRSDRSVSSAWLVKNF